MFQVYFNGTERPRYNHGSYAAFEDAVKYVKGWFLGIHKDVPDNWNGQPPLEFAENCTIEIRDEK